MSDELEFEILEDGLVKVTTDKISMPNHQNAENLFRTIAQLSGGTQTKKAKHGAKRHEHVHKQQVKR